MRQTHDFILYSPLDISYVRACVCLLWTLTVILPKYVLGVKSFQFFFPKYAEIPRTKLSNDIWVNFRAIWGVVYLYTHQENLYTTLGLLFRACLQQKKVHSF